MKMPSRPEFFYIYGRGAVENESQPFRLLHRRLKDHAPPEQAVILAGGRGQTRGNNQ